MDPIPAAGAPSIADFNADESLQLTALFDQISRRPGAWITMSIVTTFLPIPEAIALDFETGCTVGGDFTRLLDRASKTLPEVSESISPLSRISALFNRIHSCDPSIEEAFYFSDVKSKIEHPDRIGLLNAAGGGELTILQLYLDNGIIISEIDRGNAIFKAASYGHEDVVSLLLNLGAISKEDRGFAVGYAACYGHGAVVSLLLTNGVISEEDRGEAIRAAAQKGHAGVVSLLLTNGVISEEHRGMAVYGASYYGHEAVVSLLLANGAISEEDRDEALQQATLNGHEAVVSLLDGGVSDSP